ncbi:MAG: GIY-YIG nuclease family protein [Chitinophagales bacterium]
MMKNIEVIKSLESLFELLDNKDYLSFEKIASNNGADLLSKEKKEQGGVYLISEFNVEKEIALYVGRTKKLKQRIYSQHYKGNETTARLKNYLIDIDNKELRKKIRVSNKNKTQEEDLKLKLKILLKDKENYLKTNCRLRYVTDEEIKTAFKTIDKDIDSDMYRYRGVVEAYFTAVIFPKHGIYDEH